MEDLSEAILMHNWLRESDALQSDDYGFLINLYLEINQIISDCPNTPDGRHVANLLQKQANQISNQIELLEDHIDIYMSEYFNATASEASEWEMAYEEPRSDLDMIKTVRHYRKVKYNYSWNISEITGPTGDEVPDNLDMAGLYINEIDEFVQVWANEKIDEWEAMESDYFGNWFDEDDSDSISDSESLTYPFQSEINGKTFTFNALIDASVEMEYEPNGSESDSGWES